MQMAMVWVAEQAEHLDVVEALVEEPFVEVVHVASAGRRIAAREYAVSVADHDGEPLRERGISAGSAELEDLAAGVLEVEVELRPSLIEQGFCDRDGPVVE